MKTTFFILSLFISVQLLAQTSGKKYTFKEVGWSIFLPSDFTAFPSADRSIQIQPGGKTGDQPLSKRLMTAMNDANTFLVGLSSCDVRDEKFSDEFSAANKQSYTMRFRLGVQCDSATTTVSIDGVTFSKFRVTTKKNNLIQENYVALFSCYKGYSINITLVYYSKKAGEELESMLEHSKFSK